MLMLEKVKDKGRVAIIFLLKIQDEEVDLALLILLTATMAITAKKSLSMNTMVRLRSIKRIKRKR